MTKDQPPREHVDKMKQVVRDAVTKKQAEDANRLSKAAERAQAKGKTR